MPTIRRRWVVIARKSLPAVFEDYCGKFSSSLAVFCLDPTHLTLPISAVFPFSQAKNALGQEWDHVIFDARFSLNLDALAIACGTVKAGGTLFFWLENWQNYAQQQDQDAIRWAEGQPLICSHFRQFFQQQVEKAGFEILDKAEMFSNYLTTPVKSTCSYQPTAEQQALFQTLLKIPSPRVILTAKRGRGKSAFAGMWASHLLLNAPKQVVITAPNKQAIKTLRQYCSHPLPFFAPDHLLKQAKAGEIKAKWLLVDEASMLPLPMLKALSHYFPCCLFTTTLESYEGTGQGFALKFMQHTACHWQHFSFKQALRFVSNDPLESFMDTLLLQKNATFSLPVSVHAPIFVSTFPQKALLPHQRQPFYALLKSAHYRTTPSDLRRLFDAPKQQFFLCQAKDNATLLGGIWAVEEGGMKDSHLIRAIQQGIRRPKGNLVAQLLGQFALSEEVCRLRSIRISRIAITPPLQHQGLGQALMRDFFCHLQQQKCTDFISVSFGYEEKLAQFWQKCGFHLVFISARQNASSGYHSAIALRGISSAGVTLCQQLHHHFCQSLPSMHPLFSAIATPFKLEQEQTLLTPLSLKEKQALWDFAFAKRDFFMTIPLFARLKAQGILANNGLIGDFFQQRKHYAKPSKQQWLRACRQEIALLWKHNI